MPRFVILTHDHPFLHWDLMLQQEGSLRTWRLLQEPDSGGDIPAEPLGLHRIGYLDYEGPVSGNRGEVIRWDAGEFTVIEETDERWRVCLSGRKLKGIAALMRLEPGIQDSVPSTRYTGPGTDLSSLMPRPSSISVPQTAPDWTFHFTPDRSPTG